ncbi:MAG: methyltransferase domain-containing protein [Nitrososphaerales archaeon]
MSKPNIRILQVKASGIKSCSTNPKENIFHPTIQRVQGSFITKRLELVNQKGKKIVAYLDSPQNLSHPLGVVLIPPAYGESKENNLIISAYFAANGFHGLRFDWTDHSGESEGDIFNCTLSEMRDDLHGLLDHLRREYPSKRIGIVASSLAARVALKLAACNAGPDFLICFAPVVNLQYTLKTVYREDLVANFSSGKRYRTLDILGFSIDADGFLGDAVHGIFSDLLSSIVDASKVKVPTLFLVSDRDPWIQISDAHSVFQMINVPEKRCLPIPMALHRLMENRLASRNALKEAVGFLLSEVCGRDVIEDDLNEPLAEAVYKREKDEKAHLRRAYLFSRGEEQEFWKKYLCNFQYIINIQDYWNLLELIYDLLGGVWPGQKVLDAGCGNCDYGLFLLSKQMYKARQNLQYLSMPTPSYYGLDFVSDAVAEGYRRISDLQGEFRKKIGLASRRSGFLDTRLILSDLEEGVPFPDNFFDQVCCSLVISYLEHPGKVLRELCRVLNPSGKIIISSLKPDYDLSEIYRNFVSVADSEDQIEKARKLLSNAATIRLKGLNGFYQFYAEKELKQLAREAGLSRIKVFRSFGNQANLIVARKKQ